MSEFKVNTITNRDGSYGSHRYVVSLPLEVLVCNYQVVQQSFVVVEEEQCLEVVHLHLMLNVMDVVEIATTGNAVDFGDDIIARTENGAVHVHHQLVDYLLVDTSTLLKFNTIELFNNIIWWWCK